MGVYVLLLTIYLVCIFVENSMIRRLKGNKKIILAVWMLLLVLPLWFMVAFRANSVGNDTTMYEYLYNNFAFQDFLTSMSSSTMDIGFIFLSRIAGKLGLAYTSFQVLIATITYFLYSRYIYKYSNNFALSWVVFITLLSFARTMNISREMLAVAISLYAFEFLLQRKIFKYLCTVAIVFALHKSAILLILLYPFSNIKWGFVKKSIITVLCIGVGVFFDNLILIFVKITGKYSYLVSSMYSESDGNLAQVINILFGILFIAIAIYSGYLNVRKISLKKNDSIELQQKVIDEKNLLLSYVAMAIIISCAGISFGLADRAALYFTIIYTVVVPNALLSFKSKTNKYITFIIIVMSMIIYFISVMIYRNNWHTVIPYSFWWNLH